MDEHEKIISGLPKVVWENEKIRIVQIPKWEKDGTPIFITEQCLKDSLGNDAWSRYMVGDIVKSTNGGTMNLLWHLLTNFCDIVSKTRRRKKRSCLENMKKHFVCLYQDFLQEQNYH